MFTQIAIRGNDAATFLQAQLSQDIGIVSAAMSPFAAWCNPKGRVIALVRIVVLDDGYGLILPRSLATTVQNRLLMYRLRAKVTIEPANDAWRAQAVVAETDLAQLESHSLLPGAEPCSSCRIGGITTVRLSPACVEVYGADDALVASEVPFSSSLNGEDWQAARIGTGIADISAATSELYTPHMLNLDRLGALSFSKGCYPGQEVVARTQHRGSSRRRLHGFTIATPVKPGDKLTHDGRDVGEVVVSAGMHFLGLLPTDLHEAAIDVGNQRATTPTS